MRRSCFWFQFLELSNTHSSNTDDGEFSPMVPEKLPETPFWFILCALTGFLAGDFINRRDGRVV
ncbi:hypothetical protein EBAPG3_15020 [Nitrosospira lacus]|uniref:Uncharacterized protein n=1 Tax=Nitrosospira lacus TaxID=1288494 RepID=A0A1W6SNV8_9PROT|nr:hypothetical protein EBAPG3_15020 [Nitrosospira lacus]